MIGQHFEGRMVAVLVSSWSE